MYIGKSEQTQKKEDNRESKIKSTTQPSALLEKQSAQPVYKTRDDGIEHLDEEGRKSSTKPSTTPTKALESEANPQERRIDKDTPSTIDEAHQHKTFTQMTNDVLTTLGVVDEKRHQWQT